MDTFYAIPTSTTVTPLSSASSVFIDDVIRPIIPVRSVINTYPSVIRDPLGLYTRDPLGLYPKVVSNISVANIYQPTSAYYYDSGIGENPLAIHETNQDLRYKFLDKWLYDDYPQIIRMLKVNGSNITILSKSEAEKNDISNDSEADLEAKSDYIGYEILTLNKNKKILDTLCQKNNLKYYDLPHNEYFVRKAQAKYIIKKLEEKLNEK